MITVATNSSTRVEPCSPLARWVWFAKITGRGLYSAVRHRKRARRCSGGRLDLFRVRRTRDRVFVGDETVLDEVVEPRLERAHSLGPAGRQDVADLVRLAFAHERADRVVGD